MLLSSELPLASAGPIFATQLQHRSLQEASFQISLRRIGLLGMISERTELTQSSLFGLFYRKGDRREQFDYDLYDHLIHGCRRWNLGIDVESPEETFKRLEKVHESVIARADILDRLMGPTTDMS